MSKNKNAKTIHLTEECVKKLSKKAIDKNTNCKNYIEQLLENIALKIK